MSRMQTYEVLIAVTRDEVWHVTAGTRKSAMRKAKALDGIQTDESETIRVEIAGGPQPVLVTE